MPITKLPTIETKYFYVWTDVNGDFEIVDKYRSICIEGWNEWSKQLLEEHYKLEKVSE